MTLRKSSHDADNSSLPSPPHAAPSPLQTLLNKREHLDVNSADIPPVPQFTHTTLFEPPNAYQDPGNPWLEDTGQPTQVLQFSNTVDKQQSSTSNQNSHEVTLDSRGREQSRDHTPRSSVSSDEWDNFWDDDGDEQEDSVTHSAQVVDGGIHDFSQTSTTKGTQKESEIRPDSGTIKRKPVASSVQHDQLTAPGSTAPKPASNNPFRRVPSSSATEVSGNPNIPQWGSGIVGLPGVPVQSRRESGSGEKGNQSEPPQYRQFSSGKEVVQAEEQPPDPGTLTEQAQEGSPDQPTRPPPPLPKQTSLSKSQPPLIPLVSEDEKNRNHWTAEKIAVTARSPGKPQVVPVAVYGGSSLEGGQESGVVSLDDGLQTHPNAVELDSREENLIDFGQDEYPSRTALPSHPSGKQSSVQPKSPNSHSSTSAAAGGALLASDSASNKLEFHPPEGLPPTKPPRPAPIVTKPGSDDQLARMIEQRNEAYQIKHFNWFDQRSGKLRRSSMLIQNQNGPCPLLALVNALILGVREDSQAALDNALRAREHVTLGLIIETLIDELISGSNEGLPDVDELNRFLTMLHTGMNANPRFVDSHKPAPNLMDARNSTLHLPANQNQERRPGTFEATQDIRLYGSFAVPLIHGWLPSKRDPAWKGFAKSAPTYEDAQALLFGEEELEYKLSNGGLTREEEDIWKDIMAIKGFFRHYPNQLTPYGLETIQQWLSPGQFAILFRNDHFSTIYKHPQSGALFTLITDAGYADRDEIIWEALGDHSGHGEFFSGDFMSVSHSGGDSQARTPTTNPAGPRRSSQYLGVPEAAVPLSPQERQEQHDADFAMALQLQEEEEQRLNSQRGRGGSQRPSESNIPIPIRPRPQLEARPLIPPRTSRTQDVAVNRPADLDEEDAPPAYEEAAKDKPYIPPLGSPLHPSAEPSPRTSNAQLPYVVSGGSGVGLAESVSAPALPRRTQRRLSAYGENSARYGGVGASSPTVSRPMGHAYGIGAGSGFEGDRAGRRRGHSGSERDCIVM